MRKFLALVNPDAGSNFPIIDALGEFSANFDVEIETHPFSNQTPILTEFSPLETYDAIIGYGGDGTISRIANNLINRNAPPLIILPGGTANVLAKELEIPLEIEKTLQLLLLKELKPTFIDTYTLNDQPGILRINSGIFSSMITETTTPLKQTLGAAAYTFTAASQLPTAPLINYQLTIDGHTQNERAIGLMIANSGNVGMTGFNLHPSISIHDGKLDVITIIDQTFTTIAELLTMILSQAESPHIKHRSGTHIKLEFERLQTIIFDDHPITGDRFEIIVAPKSLPVIIPPHEPTL